MSRSKLVGVCLAGALSFAALASTAAQAAGPEWRQHGLPLLKTVAFSFKGGLGKIVLGAKELTWTGVTGSGTIEAPNKVSKATIVFTGSKVGTCSVKSPGKGGGEVATQLLSGPLGYIKSATKEVGIIYAGSTEFFLEIEASACNKAILLTGSVLGSLAPVNSETTKLIASFPLFSGKDRYTAFEGEGTQHILRYKESGGPEGEAPFECNEEELAASEAVEAKG
jgi:hypothetical protein